MYFWNHTSAKSYLRQNSKNNLLLKWCHQQKDLGRKPPGRGDLEEHSWKPHNLSQRKRRLEPLLGPQLCALKETLLNVEVDFSWASGKSRWACRFSSTGPSSACCSLSDQSQGSHSAVGAALSGLGCPWVSQEGGQADMEYRELYEQGDLEAPSTDPYPERSKENLVLGIRLSREIVCETNKKFYSSEDSLKSNASQHSKVARGSPHFTKC